MATLEKVMQMQQQGMSEPQIANALREEGISPKEINESISQSKIKSSISAEQPPAMEQSMMSPSMQEQQYPGTGQTYPGTAPQTEPNAPLYPSTGTPRFTQQPMRQPPAMPETISADQIPAQQPEVEMDNQIQTPIAEAPAAQATAAPGPEGYNQYQQSTTPIAPAQYAEQGYPQDQQYAGEGGEYAAYEEYQPPQATDIETINDIAEQIIEEKNAELKKQIRGFADFKDEIGTEIEKMNKRLEKVEGLFTELQTAILRKIGDYGEDIKSISNELHATQDSFSKVINPLIDNTRKVGTNEETKNTRANELKPKTKRSKKGKEDFESYLR